MYRVQISTVFQGEDFLKVNFNHQVIQFLRIKNTELFVASEDWHRVFRAVLDFFISRVKTTTASSTVLD